MYAYKSPILFLALLGCLALQSQAQKDLKPRIAQYHYQDSRVIAGGLPLKKRSPIAGKLTRHQRMEKSMKGKNKVINRSFGIKKDLREDYKNVAKKYFKQTKEEKASNTTPQQEEPSMSNEVGTTAGGNPSLPKPQRSSNKQQSSSQARKKLASKLEQSQQSLQEHDRFSIQAPLRSKQLPQTLGLQGPATNSMILAERCRQMAGHENSPHPGQEQGQSSPEEQIQKESRDGSGVKMGMSQLSSKQKDIRQ